jgi:hypothetical protein
VSELNFVADIVEERLVKGNLRWLANFTEIQRDYKVSDITFPIHASGSLQERGFLLSRLFSALVTPKYKVHLLIYTTSEINPNLLRKIILSCKNKFNPDDWIFLGLVQSQPLQKAVKDSITNTADKTVGIAAYSLASKETVTSNNVLGRGLEKQLKLTEAKFEVFDLPNYVKSFSIMFALGTLMLILLRLFGVQEATNPLTLLFMAVFALIAGYRIYKTRYHVTLSLNSKGFQLREGKKVTEGKWSHYADMVIYITPSHETCIRLRSKKETFDLPLSRVGISRKEAYNTIRQLIGKK